MLYMNFFFFHNTFYSFFIGDLHLILVDDFFLFAYMFTVVLCFFTFLEHKASLPVTSQAKYFMHCKSVSVFCVINF